MMHRATGRRLGRALASPWPVALITFAAGLAFAWLRWARYAQHQAAYFILVGGKFADPQHLPANIPVNTPAGYDGQFYYRMAKAPLHLGTNFGGVRLDFAYRRVRIGYSLVTWAASFGQAGLVPKALVVVNVVGLGVLGYLCGQWAKDLGAPALAGLLPAGFFGFVFTLARDLTEITAGVFTVAALILLRRDRHVWAAVVLSAAVLTKETTLVVVAAVFLSRLPELLGLGRSRVRPGRPDLPWLVPGVVFVLWELACAAVWGPVPILSDKGNTGVPFAAIYRILRIWLRHPQDYHLDLAQFGVLAVVALAAAALVWKSRASLTERLAFAFAMLLAVSLSKIVWDTDANEIRTVSDLWILASGLIIAARPRWVRWAIPVLVVGTGVVWVMAATTKISLP